LGAPVGATAPVKSTSLILCGEIGLEAPSILSAQR
jgi:hypothetical protein